MGSTQTCMGKKERLTAEEIKARQEEERRAVHDAYLALYREARSPHTRSYPMGVASKADFPIPPQPCRTKVPLPPETEATTVLPLSTKQRGILSRSVRSIAATREAKYSFPKWRGDAWCCFAGRVRDDGDTFGKEAPHEEDDGGSDKEGEDRAKHEIQRTLCSATPEELRELASKFAVVVGMLHHEKAGDVLDELITGFAFPKDMGHPRAILAELVQGVGDVHSEQLTAGVGPLEALLLTMMSLSDEDTDRLLGYTDVPSNNKQGESYTPRNQSLSKQLRGASRELLEVLSSGTGISPLMHQWVKTMLTVLSLCERLPGGESCVIYRPVWNFPGSASYAFLPGTDMVWFDFPSCTTSMLLAEELITEGVSMSDGPLSPFPRVVFVVEGARGGVDLHHFSQYPDEAEVLLPPGALLKVKAVGQGSQHVPAVVRCEVVETMYTRLATDKELAHVVSLAAADTRLAGNRIRDLHSLLANKGGRQEVDDETDSESCSTSDDDFEGGFLTEIAMDRIRGMARRSSRAPPPAKLAPVEPGRPVTKERLEKLGGWLREEYMGKKGDVIDELLANLKSPHPSGLADHKRESMQRLACLAVTVCERPEVKEKLAHLTACQVLVLWLYTVHGVNIDGIMGFDDAPEYPDSDDPAEAANQQKEWDRYVSEHCTESTDPVHRKRNGAIFRDINWALRTGIEDPKAAGTLRKWCKFVAVLASLSCQPNMCSNAITVYRGFNGQSAEMYEGLCKMKPGDEVLWPAFSSCTTEEDVSVSYLDGRAANALPREGKGLLYKVRVEKVGLELWHVSHYPRELEVLLPPCSRLRITSSEPNEQLRDRCREELRKHLLQNQRDLTEANQVVQEVEVAVIEGVADGCILNEAHPDYILRAFCDSRRCSRRLRSAYTAAMAKANPTLLSIARDDFIGAAEDVASDLANLQLCYNKAKHPDVALEVVEALRVVLDPDSRIATHVKTTLEQLGGAKGAEGLVERITQYTTSSIKVDDLPGSDETRIKSHLAGYCKKRTTRPDVLQHECPEFEALSRWLRALRRYAVELVSVARLRASKVAKSPRTKPRRSPRSPPVGSL